MIAVDLSTVLDAVLISLAVSIAGLLVVGTIKAVSRWGGRAARRDAQDFVIAATKDRFKEIRDELAALRQENTSQHATSVGRIDDLVHQMTGVRTELAGVNTRLDRGAEVMARQRHELDSHDTRISHLEAGPAGGTGDHQ